jgi:hypothetical protein
MKLKTYTVEVEETITQRSIYIVKAKSVKQAEEKALDGLTESEDINPYSGEVSDRSIISVELDS